MQYKLIYSKKKLWKQCKLISFICKPFLSRNSSSRIRATLSPPMISLSPLSAWQRNSRVGEGCSLLSHLYSKSLKKAGGPVLAGVFWMIATCEVISSWSAIGTQYGETGWSSCFRRPRLSTFSWVSVNEITTQISDNKISTAQHDYVKKHIHALL